MSGMKEGSSLHEEMIERNWVLKRKRKHISSGLDASTKKQGASVLAPSAKSSSSLRKKLKRDLNASQKIKGHDGYYFECEECALGGNLLCCDSCPRTYHLDCLKPPLKRAPPGKWQCPKCCEQNDDETLINAETSSRRAKRKNTIQKAGAMHSISSSGKASHSSRSSIGSNKSTSKRKASFSSGAPAFEKNPSSSSMKSSPSGGNLLMVGALETADGKTKKKSASPRRRKISVQMVPSLAKSSNSNASDSFIAEPDAYKNRNHGNKINVPAIPSSRMSKRNRKLICRIEKNKRSKADKLENVGCVSIDIFSEASPCPESCGPHKKWSPTDNRRMPKSKQERRLPKSAMQKQLEVDRIQGCRIDQKHEIGNSRKGNKAESDSESLQTKFPSSDLTSQVNHDRLDECCDDSRVLDMKESLDTPKKGCQDGTNSIAHKINGDGANESDGEGNERTLEIRGHMGKTEIIGTLIPQPSVGHSMTSNVNEPPEDSVAGDENSKVRAAKKVSEGCIVEFHLAENCGDHQSPALADLPVPCESDAIHVMITGSKSDHSAENVIQNDPIQDLKLQENDSVTYEYFVKWVGKSNIHNSWVTEDQLKILAKRKLENFKAKYGTSIINICEEQWCQPQRVIALHEFPHAGGEALVKWCGLPYDECTWEKLDDPVVQSCSHLISEFIHFETQTLDNDARNDFVKVEFQEVVSLVEQPNELKGGLLFPHQLEALNWLRKCWYKSKNVILADEMGLGKTVSASSFMSSLYCEFKVKLPSLVLVPLSTMPNWLAEFASWAPHLNVVEYHGCAKARSIIREYEWHASNPNGLHKMTKSHKFNVLLTTYEMILADSSYLRGVPWEVLVVDEGHRLKNSGSKLFNLLNTFSFQHRVLLTGTPLQNNIGEMYNLLNFLQPASFPSLSAFEEKFNELTTAEKVEELKKLVAPHMLRRLKKDAMQNIPPKTERMVPVELTSIQAEYYRAMLTKNYQILRNIGKGVAQQSMLNIVMQLRKVCNHPYLIPGTEPESGTIDFLQEMRIKASAKLTLLHSMLKILHKDGHRVLIFSQMTKLLDVLEDYLTIEFGNGTFERVDGSVSVTDRQAAITRFNQDKTRFVFLLSTRSCGLGINLATADTVIIYDSDFNPHADIQAMNRAHRIGQSNRLLVYRLVVRASVEERILQLAKKKLMLDQLFVNKSGSQKEVEDILRWGTEELFGDCDGANGPDSKDNSISKADASADGEQKHRRKVGGLGDVYKDRCTDGSVKTLWDESAILKLLDRSDLQTAMTENADGDLDNDMLGSVKSLDWSDEQINEELNNIELTASLTADGHEPSQMKEENSNIVTEENEWDRLLRIRWEKYQLREEATLGRGKRTRKAVSYRETFSSIPSEALSEIVNEDEEPEREYTAAGRALKEKYMKLRARQKERIKRRHTIELHSSAEGPESLKESAFPCSKEMQRLDSNKHLEDSRELDTSNNPDDSKAFQPFDVKNASYWLSKKGRTVKHGSHLGLSVRPDLSSDIIPPSNHLQSSSSLNCVPTSTLLPVLGLCAPNACQRHTSTRVLNSPSHQPAPNHGQRRTTITDSEFPSVSTVIERPSTDSNVAVEGKDSLIFSDTPEESLYHRLKNIIPDSYFPFGPPLPPTSERSPSDAIERLGTLSSFREKLGLPNLVSDDVPPLKFALPSLSSAKLQTEFLPNLSGCSSIKLGNGSEMDLSNVPIVPSFGRQLNEKLKLKQLMPELPPMLNLGLAQTAQQLPENHRKVLNNIMTKSQTAAPKFTNKRLKVDAWSEDELDALWIGVRRHGKGNWDAMLGDPKLKILKNRYVEELLSKWTEEQNKIMDGPVPPPKNSKSFHGLSDGMMTRALLGSKFAILGTELPNVCSHLTDIQLGCGDIMPNFPCLDSSNHLGATSESFLPLPSWQSNELGSKYIGNVSAGSLDRLEKANLPLEQPFHHSSLSGNVEALGMNLSSSNSLQQKDDASARNKRIKLPSLLEKSLHLLHETQNIHSEGSNMEFLHDAKKKQAVYKSAIAEDRVPDGSKANKLPHWLREAFSAPRHPEPALPLSVSAISQSVRLLYGEEKSMFPPFVIPDPLPLLPKDPRERLRKKRKLHRLRQAIPHNSNTMGNIDISASCSIPAELNLLSYSNSPIPPLMGYSVPPAPPLTPLSNPQTPSFTPSTISSTTLAPYSMPPESLMPYSIPPESLVPFPIPSVPPLLPSSIPTTLSLLPSFIATTLPLMPSSLPSAPSMMPFKFPSTLPWFPSSIPHAPPLMHSSAQPPPALPFSILSVPTLLPSSISLSPSSNLGSIPPLPQMMQCSITAEQPPMSCTIPLAPPLTASLPSLPRKEIGFMLPRLNFNLNSPSSSSYSAQEMQPVATASPSPAVFQFVAPSMNHATSLSSSSRPDTPSSSYPNSEVPALNISEYSDRAGVALIGDFKNIDMKHKVIISSHVGCVGKPNGEDAAQTESGKLGKTKSNLFLADDGKSVLENSSETTVADDNRSEQES